MHPAQSVAPPGAAPPFVGAHHPPPRARNKTGLYVGLGIGALAICGGIIAIVMVMRSGPRGGAASREDAVKQTFAALAAGDVDALIELTGVKELDQFVSCKKQPPDMKDSKQELARLRTRLETATEATKGLEIEIVKIGEDREPRTEPKGKEFGGAEYGCATTAEMVRHRFDVAIKVTRGDSKPVEQETQIKLIAVDGKWLLNDVPRIKLDDPDTADKQLDENSRDAPGKKKLDEDAPTDVADKKKPDDAPTDGSDRPEQDAPTPPAEPAKPSAAPQNDWNTAAGDKHPFNSATWFPELGDHPIQNRPYIHLAKDDHDCTAAEPGLRSMLGADCISLIRSLWTNAAKTHVGAISVISLTDNATALALQKRLSAGQNNGDFVQFIPPPAKSRVRLSARAPTWVGTKVDGHFLIVIEIVRTNGGEPDQTAKTMRGDLHIVAIDHIIALSFGGD